MKVLDDAYKKPSEEEKPKEEPKKEEDNRESSEEEDLGWKLRASWRLSKSGSSASNTPVASPQHSAWEKSEEVKKV